MTATIGTSSAPAPSTMTPEEWAVRHDLAVAYRMFAHWGWDDLIYTHLSARVPGTDHFLLNPFDLSFDEVTPDNLVKVDTEGNAVDPTDHVTNPAGFVIHSAVHMGREDAHCVLHLHTIDGQAVSNMAEGLLPLCQTSMFVQGFGVGYHDYEGVAVNLDERARLVRDLGDNGILVLRNHGMLAVGSSVAEAFTRMYYLERSCQVQVRTLAAGTFHQPPPATLAPTAQAGAGGLEEANVKLGWPAIVRKAHRLFPDLAG
ncbi:MAG: class II aldolase/adducin family protein [Acidimicrobiales bacterium]